jgi:AraC-like DNA-binding protein
MNESLGQERLCTKEIVKITPQCMERYLLLQNPFVSPLSAAGVRFAGFGIEKEGYYVSRFDPKWHSLIYTHTGEGRCIQKNSDTILEPGSLVIAPAHLSHTYSTLTSPWTVSWFCFAEDNAFSFNPGRLECSSSRHAGLLIHLLEELINNDTGQHCRNPAIIERSVELLLTILRNDTYTVRRNINEKQRYAIEDVFLAVHRNPGISWTVTTLLGRCTLHIGEDRFRQLCNDFFGNSPMKQVRAIRMQIVKKFLVATDYPLRVIAPMVGYGDEFSLSTAFKETEGCSPNQYRSGKKAYSSS